jgi:hypothetical protein
MISGSHSSDYEEFCLIPCYLLHAGLLLGSLFDPED